MRPKDKVRFRRRFTARSIAIVAFFATVSSGHAGHYFNGWSPGTVPWPGGVVPYEFDAALSPTQQQTYLDGLRDFELVADIEFIPRTTETEWILFKYAPGGPNLVSGTMPVTVEINQLKRFQIQHETGHALGLLHEHQRSDQGNFVTTCSGNIDPIFLDQFSIDPNGTNHGPYDFRSIMHYAEETATTAPGLKTLKVEPGFERWQELMGTLLLSPGDADTLSFLYGPPATSLSPVVTTTAEGGPGSLRAAMYYAEANPDTTITFNIPMSDPGFANGVFTIQPSGHLPEMITNGTTIDATTQPGYAGKPLVFIDGSQLIPEAGQITCFLMLGANCTVKGVGVQNYPWNGFTLRYPECENNTIAACWSGLDYTGNTGAPNAFQGVFITDGASNNFIGGTTAAECNVFSGNTQYGIFINGATTTGNVVRHSYIGTNSAGTSALGNISGGILLFDSANGNTIGHGNVISGNTPFGILMRGAGVQNNTVEGSIIGLDATGSTGIATQNIGIILDQGANGNTIGGTGPGCGNHIAGNTFYGVTMIDPGTDGNFVEGNTIGAQGVSGHSSAGVAMWDEPQGNHVGGTAPGAGNILAHNDGWGIALFDPDQALTFGHTFSSNSIYDNNFGGIFIGSGNNAQSAPILSSAVLGATGTTIVGNLFSATSTTFRLEFFASDSGSFGEGRRFLGSIDVTTDSLFGNASFNTALIVRALKGQVVTATATNLTTGDTSAFSNTTTVTATDTDGDGMPDDYEDANGLDKTINDAGLNKDGDAASNFEEFLAGTDPQDGSDVLQANSIERSGNTTTIRFATVPGIVYRIEKSTCLAPGTWRTVVHSIRATSAETTVVDSKSPTAVKCYYRAVVVP